MRPHYTVRARRGKRESRGPGFDASPPRRPRAYYRRVATVWLIDWDDAELRDALQREGHTVTVATLDEAKAATPTSDVALIRAREKPNPAVARQLCALSPATSWVWLASPDDADRAPLLLDAGAAEVVLGPWSTAAAALLVRRVTRDARARVRLGRLNEELSQRARLEDVIGESPAMKELLDKISRLSRRSALGPALSVMLSGETGTGKGLIARVLHHSSRRRDGPFVELNCAALPSGLIESELFGHEKGAFTDAKVARAGRLEAADGGTLFLDEVTYLPPDGQAKLLTVLETRRVRRLGGSAERPVDVQIVSASTHDLQKLAAEHRFLPELLHRLTALWLELPPLRARGDDSVLLAKRFLERVAATYRLPPKRLSDGATAAIRAHTWPGNVRELYHAIERAFLLDEGEVVEPEHLALRQSPASAGHGIPPEGLAAIDKAEKALIERALQAEGGNVSRAAALLKVSRDVLRSRIEKYRLEPSHYAT